MEYSVYMVFVDRMASMMSGSTAGAAAGPAGPPNISSLLQAYVRNLPRIDST